jgi:hypothetical protein
MRHLMTCFSATILLALISFPAWANELDSLLQQAKALGAPMAAVQRAIEISRQPIFPKKGALAVFDISQPSAKKRFYIFDFKSGQVTATTRPMEEIMDPAQEPQNSKASRRT